MIDVSLDWNRTLIIYNSTVGTFISQNKQISSFQKDLLSNIGNYSCEPNDDQSYWIKSENFREMTIWYRNDLGNYSGNGRICLDYWVLIFDFFAILCGVHDMGSYPFIFCINRSYRMAILQMGSWQGKVSFIERLFLVKLDRTLMMIQLELIKSLLIVSGGGAEFLCYYSVVIILKSDLQLQF